MKLPTSDLKLMINNLRDFINKVEEDTQNQSYEMDTCFNCVYAKTTGGIFNSDGVTNLLVGCDEYCEYPYTSSKLFNKSFDLFTAQDFNKYTHQETTKEKWLKVANKHVKKLEKKLTKRLEKGV